MQVAVTIANHNLQELEALPDENSPESQRKEIRTKCAAILKTMVDRCEKALIDLRERAPSPMDGGDKLKWVVKVKHTLKEYTEELEEWNKLTKKVLRIGDFWEGPPIPSSSANMASSQTAEVLWVEKLARMAVVRIQRFGQVESDSLWISPEELEFEQAPSKPQATLKGINLGIFQRHQKLKFSPRRFGHQVRADGEKVPVMVEFRQYYRNLRAERPGEYKSIRSRTMELAHVLLCANSNNVNEEETVSFPSVPFIGISELPENSPPCFLLVYSWSGMKSLTEAIADTDNRPSHVDRLKLAIDLGKSLFAFHTTGYVHGLLSTDNIFLPSPGDKATQPLLAGFDISRFNSDSTNKLDVTEPDARLYLHPERLGQGQSKDANHAPYDAYSLGVIWLEIGLWQPLRKLKGIGNTRSDNSRRQRVFRACQSETLEKEMGIEYVRAIRYILEGKLVDRSASQASNSTPAAGFVSLFGEPNAAQAIAMLPVKSHLETVVA